MDGTAVTDHACGRIVWLRRRTNDWTEGKDRTNVPLTLSWVFAAGIFPSHVKCRGNAVEWIGGWMFSKDEATYGRRMQGPARKMRRDREMLIASAAAAGKTI